MKPKILSWNVRRLNEVNKRSTFDNLLREWKLDIVCFQETKLKLLQSLVQSIWSYFYVDWIYLAFDGASGGVLLMWYRRVEEKLKVLYGS